MNQPNDFNPDFFDLPEEFPGEVEGWREEVDYLEDILVYQLSKDFADETIEFIKTVQTRRKDVRGALDQLATYAALIGAHIAAGHALGYELETIGGNIALCRRALGALRASQDAIKRIHSRYGATVDSLHLNSLAEEVRGQLQLWIRELRTRRELE